MTEIFDELFDRHPVLSECRDAVKLAAKLLCESFSSGGKVLTCGNGGSCADSGHIVGELMKGFEKRRPVPADERKAFSGLFGETGERMAACLQCALPAISLPDQAAVISAYANDVDPALVYAQLVYGYGRAGDVLIAMSTSGNSANIVNAAMAAKVRGVRVIGMTGAAPCRLDEIADVVIHVPETRTAYVQELHLPVYHALCAFCESYFFQA